MSHSKRYTTNRANSIPEFFQKIISVHDYILIAVAALAIMYLGSFVIAFLVYGGLQ